MFCSFTSKNAKKCNIYLPSSWLLVTVSATAANSLRAEATNKIVNNSFTILKSMIFVATAIILC